MLHIDFDWSVRPGTYSVRHPLGMRHLDASNISEICFPLQVYSDVVLKCNYIVCYLPRRADDQFLISMASSPRLFCTSTQMLGGLRHTSAPPPSPPTFDIVGGGG